MVKIRSVPPLPGADTPTAEGLLRHFRQYGLSEKIGYRGKKAPYSKYKKLLSDPLIEVAFDYLGENAYVYVVEGCGYAHFAEEARADWRAEHLGDEA